MQRAAASSPQTTSPKPNDSEPPSKRRRVSDDRRTSIQTAEARAMAEALAAEEAKRQRAIDHQAAAAGETKWEFSYLDQAPESQLQPMRITSVGFSTIDGSDTEEQSEQAQTHSAPGRRNFGQFGKAVPVCQPTSADRASADYKCTETRSGECG